jgi:hypothetical protein
MAAYPVAGASAAERRAALEAARPPHSPTPPPHVWSDDEMMRLRLAFAMRFDEPQPRTETLLKVASEGIRIFLERTAGEPK